MDMADELVEEIVEEYTADKMPEEWDLKSLGDATYRQFGFRLSLDHLDGDLDGDLRDVLLDLVEKRFAAKRDEIGPELFKELQQMVMLQIVDNHWKDHLLSMDHLRDGIGLRGYAQVDPLREYQREGYDMFMGLIHRIKADSRGHPVPPPGAAPPGTPAGGQTQGQRPWCSATATAAPPSPRSARRKRWAATTPAPAAAARNIRSAAGSDFLRRGPGDVLTKIPHPPLKLPSQPPVGVGGGVRAAYEKAAQPPPSNPRNLVAQASCLCSFFLSC